VLAHGHHRTNAGLISLAPSAYFNSCGFVEFVSQLCASASLRCYVKEISALPETIQSVDGESCPYFLSEICQEKSRAISIVPHQFDGDVLICGARHLCRFMPDCNEDVEAG
jgi:hypothetical protein